MKKSLQQKMEEALRKSLSNIKKKSVKVFSGSIKCPWCDKDIFLGFEPNEQSPNQEKEN